MSDGKYSVLYAGQKLEINEISELLKLGYKILWFGNGSSAIELENAGLDVFIDARYLSIFNNPYNVSLVVEDGKFSSQERNQLLLLAKGDMRFNVEQYFVEHTDISKQMIVEAGAGAGKTKVMIDRILFLMSVVDGLHFKDIAMITFTNKATDSMRQDLLEELNRKYALTGQKKYCAMMEQVSQLTSSTIHSFFKKIMVEIGPVLGYGTDIGLRGYIQEKRNILRNLMDELYGEENQSVRQVLGIDTYKVEKLAMDYWLKIDNKGLSETETALLNWGNANGEAKQIQKTLTYLFGLVNERYDMVKYENNAISMQDILHELNRVIDIPSFGEYLTRTYKYIFVDEFQDSDTIQIKIISKLLKQYRGFLFVVGDIKQSIYRFRGANDTAFFKLEKTMEEDGIEKPEKIVLKKNYRTAANVLNIMHPIFESWGAQQLIDYSGRMDAARIDLDGVYKQVQVTNSSRKERVVRELREILDRLAIERRQAKDSGKEYKRERIMFLTRFNYELASIKSWCDEEGIVCVIRDKGKFYQSNAVLDFVALCESYLYAEEPMYLYNYLTSSYCKDTISNTKICEINGDLFKLYGYFSELEAYQLWSKFEEEFKNKPVFSVLVKIIDETRPVEIYVKRQRNRYIAAGKDETDAANQAKIDAIQYKYDLNKLIKIIKEQFAGEFASLYDICQFLRIKIRTDNSEDQDIPAMNVDFDYVEGMTVHSAKGLQFDNVLIPFMQWGFTGQSRSDVIIAPEKDRIGWKYQLDRESFIANDNYRALEGEEMNSIRKDEARLLYVAMTRAIKGLFCFVTRGKNDNNTWSDLLPRERDVQ